MRNIKQFLLVFSLLISATAICQSLSPFVISSTGNFSTAGGNSLSSTTGEVAVTTLASANNFLTQGFQQPERNNTFVVTLNNSPIHIDVYPNPTTDLTFITIQGTNLQKMDVSLYDLLGRKVMTASQKSSGTSEQTFTFDLTSLPATLYFVRVTNIDGKDYATVKLNKIN